MLKRIFKQRSTLLLFVMLLPAFSVFKAQAVVTCEPYDTTIVKNDVISPMLGSSISVGEDVPVGTIVYTQTYTPMRVMLGWRCKYATADLPVTIQPFKRGKRLSAPLGAPTYMGSKPVYPTNVPGIGFYLGISAGSAFGVNAGSQEMPYEILEKSETYSTGSGHGSAVGPLPTFTIQLIKTGPVTEGVDVAADLFPTFEFSQGITLPVEFEQPFLSIRFTGSVKVVSRTCQIDDVDVDLGRHQLSDFSGYYSASPWKEFNITLRNCPPFYGYNSTPENFTYTESTGELTGAGVNSKPSELKFVFNSVHGSQSSTIAKLEAGDDAATNLGLQMAYALDNSLVNIDGTKTYTNPGGLVLKTTDNATYTLPLKARYYRYYPSGAVTPGKANAAIAFTVSYF